MATNQVQMQPGLSLRECMDRFGTEAQCEAALIDARWPDGFVCPECRCRRHTTFERQGRTHWQCQRCRHQATATSNTIFASTKLSLTVWFLAMHLLNNVSALALRRELGVRYKAARRIQQKLMQAMVESESHRP